MTHPRAVKVENPCMFEVFVECMKDMIRDLLKWIMHKAVLCSSVTP